MRKQLITSWHDPATGKRVPAGTAGAEKRTRKSAKWYAFGVPGSPRPVPLFKDKAASQARLAELLKAAEGKGAGLRDESHDAALVPLETHLADYAAHLRDSGGTTEPQVRQVLARCRRVFAAGKARRPGDLDAARLGRALAALKAARGLSNRTRNFHLGAVRQLCRWLVREKRLREDPTAALKKLRAEEDIKQRRRAMTTQEVARLLQAARRSQRRFRGLSGEDRFTLYVLALATGMRKGSLAALRARHCLPDGDPPLISLPAKSLKNRKARDFVLPPAVAELLRDYVAGKAPGDPVFPGNWWERAAVMLERDLKEAGVPKVVEGPHGPEVLVFHSTRHTFLSILAQAGVNVKVLQLLAGHSDPRLTIGVYTHAGRDSQAEALAKLPDLTGAEADPLEGLGKRELAALVRLLGGVLGLILGKEVSQTVNGEGGGGTVAGEA